ncbi:MAG: glycosyltransferase [Serratia marcescens]|uniref:glycosyltransferase family 2 protein n=1 Tax=Serratia TaxID=613 RepID=UPI0013DCEE22|nr:glycosyltransferase [Serratia marcescens]MBI6132589.1 glycosyltransferase [Serratia marcescens]MDU7805925.1 glycosyltransferase [Serratia marcescens]NSM21545.1 glycosyltransferase [Serratia marcescens]NSM50108.1 glycosyltransferase [Serratia marcescens]BEN53185.1 capsular polysaccharide biosynthesis protein [Serratia marcescens]
MNPKVSVVIASYNTEKYIVECVNSVLNQDYPNVELVVVNDGSTDATGALLAEVTRNHTNVKVVNQENQGQSAARNNGVSVATGEFVVFLDSDDIFDVSLVSKCVTALVSTHSDIVFFNAETFYDDDEFPVEFSSTYVRDNSLYDKTMDSGTFFKESWRLNNYIVSPCMYMSRIQLVRDNPFYPGIIHEDNLFTTSILLAQRSTIVCLKESLYKRRLRRDSVMTSKKNHRHVIGYLTVARKLPVLRSRTDRELNNYLNSFISRCVSFSINDAKSCYGRVPKALRKEYLSAFKEIGIMNIKKKVLVKYFLAQL